MDASAAARERIYTDVVDGLGDMFAAQARAFAELIAPPCARVLDIGCGSGVWGLALAERIAGARVTGLDFAAVLPAFRRRAARMGLGDRVDELPGDAREIEIERRAFDVVVLANVIHLDPPDRARALTLRAAEAVAPAGALAVIDALRPAPPGQQRAAAAYALHLALRTDRGLVHPTADVVAWLADAGLGEPAVHPLPGRAGALGVVIARRTAEPRA
jgi:SAM-dependent methyltransferase